MHTARNAELHIPFVGKIGGFEIDKVDPAAVRRLLLLGREHLNQQDLLMKIAEIINRFFPIAVGKEIGNNNRKPVAVAEIGTALDRGFEIGLLGKLRVFPAR